MTARSLSFVVPVRNDAARLERCLRSIRRSAPADVQVEIVVADNGSTDRSVEVARSAGAVVLSLPDLRLGQIRNQAAAATTGSHIAFIDADHEIVPDWIPAALEALSNPNTGAVGAPYLPPSPATWVQRFYDRLRRHPAGQEQTEWLGSGNIAMPRKAFDEVGGFDITLETCEDVDLCRKLRARGYALLSDQRMKNVHYGDPRTLGQVFAGELWRGRDNVRVSLRAPVSGRTLCSAALPIANLAAVGLVCAGLVTRTTAGLAIAEIGGLGLLAMLALRASVMVRNESIREWPKAMAVAAAYEAGRALALIGRFGYGRRRRAALA